MRRVRGRCRFPRPSRVPWTRRVRGCSHPAIGARQPRQAGVPSARVCASIRRGESNRRRSIRAGFRWIPSGIWSLRRVTRSRLAAAQMLELCPAALRRSRSVARVFAHVGQSLDGQIATQSGASRSRHRPREYPASPLSARPVGRGDRGSRARWSTMTRSSRLDSSRARTRRAW